MLAEDRGERFKRMWRFVGIVNAERLFESLCGVHAPLCIVTLVGYGDFWGRLLDFLENIHQHI